MRTKRPARRRSRGRRPSGATSVAGWYGGRWPWKVGSSAADVLRPAVARSADKASPRHGGLRPLQRRQRFNSSTWATWRKASRTRSCRRCSVSLGPSVEAPWRWMGSDNRATSRGWRWMRVRRRPPSRVCIGRRCVDASCSSRRPRGVARTIRRRPEGDGFARAATPRRRAARANRAARAVPGTWDPRSAYARRPVGVAEEAGRDHHRPGMGRIAGFG